MAQYNGFKCDTCGAVMDPDDRTKVTTRFEGAVEGETHNDKCPKCIAAALPEGVAALRPIRRRRKNAARRETPTDQILQAL
jgi:hypothetical protein